VNRAIQTAIDLPDSFAALGGLSCPVFVFALQDRITGSDGAVRRVVAGVKQETGGDWSLVRDWELVKLLNGAADKPRSAIFNASAETSVDPIALLASAEAALRGLLDQLELPFQLPMIEPLAMLLPGTPTEAADGRDEL
jgi:hypothetical protein